MTGNVINWGKPLPKSARQFTTLPSMKFIQLAFVRDTADPQRMGRLRVWIPNHGPDLDDHWYTVSYCSPFAGTTNIDDAKPDGKQESDSQKSYGFWAVPPDVGNQVMVCFINGDPARGFWLGCVYPQNMNHMVPGIAVGKSTDDEMNKKFKPQFPPVVEYNKKDKDVDPKKADRPVRTKLAQSLITQGLHKDSERGVTNSSARREDTSKVMGWLSPGGNSLVMDDADDNSFIRLRTQSGTQVFVSETSGFIYMITKGGKSWMEISDGAIDIFSEAPISLRSKDDVNIRADGDLNLDAGGNVNIHASGNIGIGAGDDINIKSGAALHAESSGKFSAKSGGDLALQGAGDVGIRGGSNVGIHAGGNAGLSAGGNVITDAGGQNGRKGSSLRDSEDSHTGGVSGAPEAISADAATVKAASSMGGDGGHVIVTRLPTHEPFDHPINAHSNTTGDGSSGNGSTKDGDGNTTNTGPITADNSPVRKINGREVSDKVNACIYQASQKTGVSYSSLMAVAAQESNFKPNAGASTSSAKGLFQFTSGTWKDMYSKYGPNGTKVKNPTVKNDVYDPCSNALLGAYYYKENTSALAAAGLPTGPNEAYAAHFLGSGGAKSFLRGVKNNPNAPASSSVSAKAISANHNVFYKPGGQMRTNQEVYNWMNSRVGGTTPQWEAFKSSTVGK